MWFHKVQQFHKTYFYNIFITLYCFSSFLFFLSMPVLYQFLNNLLSLTYWNFTDVDVTFLLELPMQILLLPTVSISRKHKYLFNCFTIKAVLHLTAVFVIFEIVVLQSAKSILLKYYKFNFF